MQSGWRVLRLKRILWTHPQNPAGRMCSLPGQLQAYLGWLPLRMRECCWRETAKLGCWCRAPPVLLLTARTSRNLNAAPDSLHQPRRRSDVSWGFCHCSAHLLPQLPTLVLWLKKRKKEEKEAQKTLLMYNIVYSSFHLWDAFRILEGHVGPWGREQLIILMDSIYNCWI